MSSQVCLVRTFMSDPRSRMTSSMSYSPICALSRISLPVWMYFLISWTNLFIASREIGCSHLLIRLCISSSSHSSLNNLRQLCKKDLTNPVGSLSTLGLIFNGCWSSPAKGSLYNGVLSIPFPLSLVFEQEAPLSQNSLSACTKVSFSFSNSKVGGLIVDFRTHSAVVCFALPDWAPSISNPLRVTTFNFCYRVRSSAPIN